MSSDVNSDNVYTYKGTVRVEVDECNELRLEIEPLTGMFKVLEEDIIESLKMHLNGVHNLDNTITLASYEIEVSFKIIREDVSQHG